MNAIRVYALKRNCNVAFHTECVTVHREKSEIRVFTLSEEKRLVTYLKEHLDLTAIGILVCLYTGIRIGELCALKWNHVNIEEKTMKIGQTMQRLPVIGMVCAVNVQTC